MSDDQVLEGLRAKLHPRVFPNCSPMMHYIMSTIVRADWVRAPRGVGHFSITSDGFVVDGGVFLGSAADFQRNIQGYVEAAGLAPAERDLFSRLYSQAVTDWRHLGASGPAVAVFSSSGGVAPNG